MNVEDSLPKFFETNLKNSGIAECDVAPPPRRFETKFRVKARFLVQRHSRKILHVEHEAGEIALLGVLE